VTPREPGGEERGGGTTKADVELGFMLVIENRAGATSFTLYCLCIQTVGYYIIDGVLVHIRSTAPITHDR
jgi:hypothetical protein